MKCSRHKKLRIIVLALGICVFYACEFKQVRHLRLMTYNIRHGVGMDSILDLSRAVGIINAHSPDLCALQEIDNYCLRSDSVGQTDFLGEKTNMTATFGKFMDFDGGSYGMATLSAYPVVSTKVLQLPMGLEEPRTAIIHEVEIVEDLNIFFVNVHLDWIESKEGILSRLDQAGALMSYIDTLNAPILIAGDFNCTPDSPTMKFFEEKGFEFINKGDDHLSFQGEPKLELDHVIFRNSKDVIMKPENIYLLNEALASDHRPLIVDLEIVY